MLIKRTIVETFDNEGNINREITEEFSEGVVATHNEKAELGSAWQVIKPMFYKGYDGGLVVDLQSQIAFNAMEFNTWYSVNSSKTKMLILDMHHFSYNLSYDLDQAEVTLEGRLAAKDIIQEPKVHCHVCEGKSQTCVTPTRLALNEQLDKIRCMRYQAELQKLREETEALRKEKNAAEKEAWDVSLCKLKLERLAEQAKNKEEEKKEKERIEFWNWLLKIWKCAEDK